MDYAVEDNAVYRMDAADPEHWTWVGSADPPQAPDGTWRAGWLGTSVPSLEAAVDLLCAMDSVLRMYEPEPA